MLYDNIKQSVEVFDSGLGLLRSLCIQRRLLRFQKQNPVVAFFVVGSGTRRVQDFAIVYYEV